MKIVYVKNFVPKTNELFDKQIITLLCCRCVLSVQTEYDEFVCFFSQIRRMKTGKKLNLKRERERAVYAELKVASRRDEGRSGLFV